MNTHLVNFYKTWLHWATHENAANPAGFRKHVGLCSNLGCYCRWLGLTGREATEIICEMGDQFVENGLHRVVPFDMDETVYYDEPDKRKNPLRRQWCIDRIAEAEGHD